MITKEIKAGIWKLIAEANEEYKSKNYEDQSNALIKISAYQNVLSLIDSHEEEEEISNSDTEEEN